jgi:excisionase family DNA binding protein
VLSEGLLSVQGAAARLGVHRSRVEALILAGALPAQRVGSQWLLDGREVDLYDQVRPRRRGRLLSAAAAWARINEPVLERSALDDERRELRSRSSHEPVYLHPGVLREAVDDRSVRLGGRDAAIHAGAPLDDGVHDVYLPASVAPGWSERFRARPDRSQPNVWLHVVPDVAWTAVPEARHLGLFVAWLDLADRFDRGADVVLDRLTGGRARA